MKKYSYAIFGSALNPPHRGHEDVIRQALEVADKVLVVPSYRHAFSKAMAPFDQRLRMAEALVKVINAGKAIEVSNIEKCLSDGNDPNRPVYTFDLLEALERELQTSSLTFVLGPDNAAPEVWNTFYRAKEIRERWGMFVAKQHVAVRSTQLRKKLVEGKTITPDECPPSIIAMLPQFELAEHNSK